MTLYTVVSGVGTAYIIVALGIGLAYVMVEGVYLFHTWKRSDWRFASRYQTLEAELAAARAENARLTAELAKRSAYR